MIQRVTIERLGSDADGIGRLDSDKTLFVALTCPGDVVDVEVIEERERFARGSITDIVDPSPRRATPSCQYFGVCGGCGWQHVGQDLQLETKRQMVIDAMNRIGHIEIAADLVRPTIATKPLHYRNKIELTAFSHNGRFTLGMAKRGSHEYVEIDSCPLLPKRAANLPKAIAGALRYVGGNQSLDIDRVAIRVAANTSDIEIAIYTAPGPFPRAMVAKVLNNTSKNISSIVRVMTKEKRGVPKIAGVEALVGKGFWREKLRDFEYLISAPSFFQVNTAGGEILIKTVMDFLAPDEEDIAFDLYCGAGTFTLPLAEHTPDVIGIESTSSAVKDLRRNLEVAGLDADVVGGDAAREIGELGGADVAVVDPPRAGLDSKVIDALLANPPRSLAYVSCDPATLARDLALLQAGFDIQFVQPVDLFAQTHHVECVVGLTRI